MKTNDPGLDEIWQDFYATLTKGPSYRTFIRKKRESMIRVAWLYNYVANTGTNTPVYELARLMECSVEEAAELVERCLDLRLLCMPKRGNNRCELSVMAVKMIERMEIGRHNQN